MSNLRSPIRWFGGKGMMLKKILPILAGIPHKRYCEPFGGGASILIAKPPVQLETYNDLDGGLYNFFTVLADEALYEQFYRQVQALPYSRQLYNECRTKWQNETDAVKRAAMWFVVARQSFGGRFSGGWGMVATATNRNMAGTTNKWLSCIDMLPEIHQRLQRVQIENSDYMRIFEIYDTPETLFYCDPPYVVSTRSAGAYTHELDDSDHQRLLDAVKSLKGHAVLSGYPNALYDNALKGWERYSFKIVCHAAGRTRASGLQGEGAATAKQERTECVWTSPGAQRQQRMF